MHVVITGANRGIGQALARRYHSQGHRVTGTARNGGADAVLDVTDPVQHRALAMQLSEQRIDLLICNAGVYLDHADQLDDGYPSEKWSPTFATNVTGVFLTIQHLLPCLSRGNQPRIAIISSDLGSQAEASGGSYIYRASKAAVLNLGRNLAVDLQTRKIAVGIYHPGWVQSDMGGKAAQLTVDEAAEGLSARFENLSMDNTGCFECWDGRAQAF